MWPNRLIYCSETTRKSRDVFRAAERLLHMPHVKASLQSSSDAWDDRRTLFQPMTRLVGKRHSPPFTSLRQPDDSLIVSLPFNSYLGRDAPFDSVHLAPGASPTPGSGASVNVHVGAHTYTRKRTKKRLLPLSLPNWSVCRQRLPRTYTSRTIAAFSSVSYVTER